MTKKIDDLRKKAKADENHSSFSAAEKEFADEASAAEAFAKLRRQLFDVDEWNEHGLVSSFELFDASGQIVQTRKFAVGEFLRISLPATFKYDWVRIAEITDEQNEFVITVKPTFDPTAEKRDESVISHFFTAESTNNFCLLKRDTIVGLYVIGLNEKMNASDTENTLETVRNAAVNLGAYFGIQRGEWEKFCHHFMDDIESGEPVETFRQTENK